MQTNQYKWSNCICYCSPLRDLCLSRRRHDKPVARLTRKILHIFSVLDSAEKIVKQKWWVFPSSAHCWTWHLLRISIAVVCDTYAKRITLQIIWVHAATTASHQKQNYTYTHTRMQYLWCQLDSVVQWIGIATWMHRMAQQPPYPVSDYTRSVCGAQCVWAILLEYCL